mgnify:CR=1 FL=1|jgi:thioredoxin 1
MANEVSFYNRNELKTFLKDNPYVIIRVSATWCGPCKKIQPLLNERINNLPDNIKVVYVDYDKHRDVATSLKIQNVPTFMFFKESCPDICLVGAQVPKVVKFFDSVVAKVIN